MIRYVFGDDDEEEEQDEPEEESSEEEYSEPEEPEEPEEEPDDDEKEDPEEEEDGTYVAEDESAENSDDEEDIEIEDLDLDDEVYASAEDYPNASAEDFEDDNGDWTDDDYNDTAQKIFGDGEYFGDTAEQQLADEGFTPHPEEKKILTDISTKVPGADSTLGVYTKGGQTVAQGFITMAGLTALQKLFPGIDISNLNVSVPAKGDDVKPQPLPPELANVDPKDAVDLRKYATPVGDQGQTSRCSAFAWTHALEMAHNIIGNKVPRLSPSHTMLEFQKMQGDYKDHRYAHAGGDGTVGGPDPGKTIVTHGACRQDLWPDDRPEPVKSDSELDKDAQQYALKARVVPIAMDDVKKVLSAGFPVHVAMNTGEAFSDVGRDGLFNAAEKPSGQHGRHAMLCTGYLGNHFIVKNSWGTDWGDKGYCYIPKKVLAESEPQFVALMFNKKDNQ